MEEIEFICQSDATRVNTHALTHTRTHTHDYAFRTRTVSYFLSCLQGALLHKQYRAIRSSILWTHPEVTHVLLVLQGELASCDIFLNKNHYLHSLVSGRGANSLTDAQKLTPALSLLQPRSCTTLFLCNQRACISLRWI